MTEYTEVGYDLSDLLRERRHELGLALRPFAERCMDPLSGERLLYGRLSKLERREPVAAPTPAQLRALAAGLELPLRRVQQAAAAQFLGIPLEVWSSDGTTRLLTSYVESMTEEDQAKLLEIAELYAGKRKKTKETRRK